VATFSIWQVGQTGAGNALSSTKPNVLFCFYLLLKAKLTIWRILF